MEESKILNDLKKSLILSKDEIKAKYHVSDEVALNIYKEYRRYLYKKLMGDYKRNISDKLALGYGSKYQLLRMLGWHRNDFNLKVSQVLNISNDINWLDFEFNGFEDKELFNADFIPSLVSEWQKIWKCSKSTGINWDAVGLTKDGTYILLEAKAHVNELKGNTAQSNNPLIINSIQSLMDKYHIKADINDWLIDNYQLANRLVFLNFLKEHGIKAKFLYVFFVDGYVFNTAKKEESLIDWQNALDKELTKMKIKGSELEKEVNVLYYECNVA